MTAVARRTIRWAAIGLNLAAACYYGVAVVRFLFAVDYPSADKVGFILSFHGFVYLSGFVAPALAVTALLIDSAKLKGQRETGSNPFTLAERARR